MDGSSVMTVNDNIIRAREKRGYSQTQLANLLGIPQPTYACYELGKRRIPLSLIMRLSEVLGMGVDHLLTTKRLPVGFETAVTVGFSDVDEGLRAKTAKLVEYMQESSILHTESTGHPMSWYRANSRGFLLTNWQIEIYDYPMFQDSLTVRTWPTYLKGFVAERSFCITNAVHKEIVKANSGWIFCDLAKREPAKAPPELMAQYGAPGDYAIQKDYKIAAPDNNPDFLYVTHGAFTASRRDIDCNAHINNVRYLEWALDCIPYDAVSALHVSKVKIIYKKECTCGEAVRVEVYGNATSDEWICIIRNNNDENIVYAQVYTQWNGGLRHD